MFSRGLQVTQVRSIDLGIGDIIILKKDDPVTVDILVLECKDENCVISTNQVDGLINFSIRHPVNLAASTPPTSAAFHSKQCSALRSSAPPNFPKAC